MARVATKGTVQATASSDQKDNGKADTGAWTAGEVTETTDPKLSVGGAAVVQQATCTFSFNGSKGPPPSPPAVIKDSSVVTLSPQQTTLQGGQTAVLLDGDSASDTFGNTLKVSVPAASKLASG
jgi:hypothetical protein